jgi:hypothetical protein
MLSELTVTGSTTHRRAASTAAASSAAVVIFFPRRDSNTPGLLSFAARSMTGMSWKNPEPPALPRGLHRLHPYLSPLKSMA